MTAKTKRAASFDLPDSVFSPQDLGALILEVKQYAHWAAHAGVKQQLHQKITSQPPTLSPAATEILHLHSWANQQPLDSHGCEQLITALNELKTSAPVMTVTLAAPPTKDTKTTLVRWCRQNISAGMLVTFQFNAGLLGGMVVRFGSHIYDWSFRRQILENRGKFAEVLRRV